MNKMDFKTKQHQVEYKTSNFSYMNQYSNMTEKISTRIECIFIIPATFILTSNYN